MSPGEADVGPPGAARRAEAPTRVAAEEVGIAERRPRGLWRWTPLLVFVVALAPRWIAPSPFLTWDEPTWTYRSLRFARALERGEPAATWQSPHPGVVTLWAGTGAIALRRALLGPPEDPWAPPGGAPGLAALRADLAWVDELPDFDEDDVALLRAILPWLNPARRAMALVTALLVGLAAFLLLRLLRPGIALAGGLLLALDPYLLAHSRVLHLDATLALLLLASTLAALVHLRRREERTDVGDAPAAQLDPAGRPPRAGPVSGWILLAGALGGMAMLEKSPGLFIAPFTAGLVLVVALGRDGLSPRALRARLRGSAGALLARVALTMMAWGLAAGLAYVLLWPALWADPLATAGRMWAYGAAAAGGAREAVYFLGRVRPDPGPLFYLAAIPFRLTAVTLLGLLPGLWVAGRELRRGRWALAGLALLSAGYLLAMGLSGKKFERYALPAALPLDLLAVAGLAWLGARLSLAAGRPALARASAAGVLVAALAWQALVVLRWQPDLLARYNGMLGGGPAAARILPVGWGEGTDRAVAWLNARENAAELRLATPSMTLVGPRFAGTTLPAKDWPEADYVLLYVDDAQIGEPREITSAFRDRRPDARIRVGDLEVAWIYRVDEGAAPR